MIIFPLAVHANNVITLGKWRICTLQTAGLEGLNDRFEGCKWHGWRLQTAEIRCRNCRDMLYG